MKRTVQYSKLFALVLAAICLAPDHARGVDAVLVLKESGHWVNTMPPYRLRAITDMIQRLSQWLGTESKSIGLTYRAPWFPTGNAHARIPIEATLDQLQTLRTFLIQGPSPLQTRVTLTPQQQAENEKNLFSDHWLDPNPPQKLEFLVAPKVRALQNNRAYLWSMGDFGISANEQARGNPLTVHLSLTAYVHSVLSDVLVDGKSIKNGICQQMLSPK